MQHIINAQGLNMPKLGLGTWPMLGEECTRAVEQALALGYRHIDTAAAYNNEDAVGQALANSPTPREQIHVTTKVWWDQLQPDAMRHSMDRSLEALRSEYVDLFMLHWPTTDWDLPRTIETLVSFKEQGLARNIGVANFPLPLLRKVVEELGAPLSAIQVEYHVLLGQNALLDYARQQDLALTAYTPLARNKVSDIPAIRRIAAKHGVLPTQVALKWLLDQPNVAAIPKASSEPNQLANLAALDVRLDDEDRALIASLSKRERQVSPDFAPVWDAFDE
ncbi:aldo/keto reductase [Pseudomonas jessenii]|jgi:2,5-diketo-D-gluconate reductase B|uniref:2,5-diketo-D-gluconate reductase B n=2 Tax=Pseudomonas TaxID=286 RepID=A0A231FWU8_PSEJE|nr:MULTISPECIES: aldo/keto reductase [Pseudomonas]OXR28798.1 aldo/keto reductase [Pseudomonas jessenii]SEB31028.1 2,5-diketo-D-gluconate reductase B [Pseudomonas jessenii]VVQ12917.1 2,5-diketo-D-gluconic acid reductase B [Pseudomonas fluorescens]